MQRLEKKRTDLIVAGGSLAKSGGGQLSTFSEGSREWPGWMAGRSGAVMPELNMVQRGRIFQGLTNLGIAAGAVNGNPTFDLFLHGKFPVGTWSWQSDEHLLGGILSHLNYLVGQGWVGRIHWNGDNCRFNFFYQEERVIEQPKRIERYGGGIWEVQPSLVRIVKTETSRDLAKCEVLTEWDISLPEPVRWVLDQCDPMVRNMLRIVKGRKK